MLFLASSVDAIDTAVVCACVGMRRMVWKICVCVSVCVWGERQRDRQTDRQRHNLEVRRKVWKFHSEFGVFECQRVCVCVCVCVKWWGREGGFKCWGSMVWSKYTGRHSCDPSRHLHHPPLPLLEAARAVSNWTVFLRCQISSVEWTYRVFVLWPETKEARTGKWRRQRRTKLFELPQKRQCRYFFPAIFSKKAENYF